MCMCPVYTWWNSLEAAPVTGSLLFVAPVCHLAKFSDCVIVLHVSRVYADSLLYIVGSDSLTIFWDNFVAVMVTGSGQPKADRTGMDYQVQVKVTWNAPEAFMTLDSAGIYDLDTKCVPGVLGLRAQCPEVAVVKVMSGRDSRSVWVLVPDENVRDRSVHDVTLLDMVDAEWPDIAVSDLSILRLQWPVSVVSGMARQQLELEKLRHACKTQHRGAQTGFCRKVIKLDMA